MIVKEVLARSIITKSGLPDSDYVINPYVGCQHGCIYCYARFMKRFTNHKEKWGEFIDVKMNSPDLIPKTSSYKGRTVCISSVTDPYQAIEKKYGLMRGILEKLVPLQPKLCILTKSDLITRDIDLIKRMKSCKAGLSISVNDDRIRKEVEPFAPSIEKRTEALKELKKAGIRTFVFISPMFPELTDWKTIVRKTEKYADEMWFENLNVRGYNWNDIRKWLKSKHPELLKKYEEVYFTKNGYWNGIEKEIRQYCRERGIKHSVYFHHSR